MLGAIPLYAWSYTPICLELYPYTLGAIPQYAWSYTPIPLELYPNMLGAIPLYAWSYTPICLELYPYMFGAIPLYAWSYTPICYQGVDRQNFVVCFLLGNSPASEFRRLNSDAGELPRRKRTIFRTRRKFEIKVKLYHSPFI